jgi:FkbM family methyltransferase
MPREAPAGAPAAAENFRSPYRIARRFRYLPWIIWAVENWPGFMRNYALGTTSPDYYRFRNGARLKIGRAVEHVPLIEVFLKKEYGKVRDGSVVIDIGASNGVFSVYAVTSATDVAVYAYEPLVESYDLMVANVAANSSGAAVRCYNLAVAGDAGRRPLYVENSEFFFPTLIARAVQGRPADREVACTTLREILDAHGLEHVDLLKMDCEGSEYAILYATPASHLARIGEIRMEYHNLGEAGCNIDALARFLEERGFRISRLRRSSEANGVLWAERGR